MNQNKCYVLHIYYTKSIISMYLLIQQVVNAGQLDAIQLRHWKHSNKWDPFLDRSDTT